MGALPRPELPPGAHRELVDALHELHHGAGWPSLRTLAKAAGCSPTTVSKVFSSPRLPTWGLLELIVEHLDGDVGWFHRLWFEAGASRADRLPAPGLAGRSSELAVVRRHLESGTGLLVVTGEAGMGKSRLVAAAVDATDALVASGSCLPLSQSVPLMPVADALAAAWASDGGHRTEQVLAGDSAHIRAALGRLLPELAVPVGADPDQRQVFASVERLLATTGDVPRMALVLDDLHWADPATLDLLEHVVARRASVGLLGTWRLDDPTLPDATREWWERIRRQPNTSTLALGPLDRAATAEQIARLGVTPGPDLVDRIFRRSRGQPLFTEQLAVHGGDSGALPDLLADLLDRRLRQLHPDAQLVASRLGVVDRPLSLRDLAALVELPGERLDPALRQLADRYLLASRSTDVALRHPLLAEAARQRLLPHERQSAHGQVARLLGGSAVATAAEVAEHWRAAGEPDLELPWRERSARAAGARGSTGQAAGEWLRVLELWPDDGSRSPADHADALVEAMTCLGGSSAVDRAAHLVPRALDIVPSLDPGTAARVLATAGNVLGAVRGPAEALPLIQHAIAIHETLPPSSDYVRALSQLAGQLRGMGRFDEAGGLVERAVTVSQQIDDAPLLRNLLELLAWHQTLVGHAPAAAATRARADAITTSTPPDLVTIGVARTDALLVSGAPCGDVEAAAAPGLALALDQDISSHAVTLLQSNTAQAMIRAGHITAAWELIDPHTRGRPGVDNWPVFIERMWLESLRGHHDDAMRLLEAVSAVPITAATNRAERTERAAVVELWSGDPSGAQVRVTRTLEELRNRAGSVRAGALLTLLARATAEVADGRPSPAAGAALEEVRGSLTHDPIGAEGIAGDRLAHARQWDAELGRVRGRHDPALWSAAASAWDALGRPHDAAYCRWRGAQAALGSGQGVLAGRLLRRAARDAREHIPLGEAIARTGAYAQSRERA